MPIKVKETLPSKGARLMMDTAIARATEFGIAITVPIVDDGRHWLMATRLWLQVSCS